MTLEEQIRCVGREIGLRKNVYPKFLKSGRITQEDAAYQIACMEAVYETLKGLQAAQQAKAASVGRGTWNPNETPEELAARLARISVFVDEVNAKAEAAQGAAPVAWMHRNGQLLITAEQREGWVQQEVQDYNIPLYMQAEQGAKVER